MVATRKWTWAAAALCVLLWAASLPAQTYDVLTRIGNHPFPWGGLVQGLDGKLYSTTAGKRRFGFGKVFSVTAAGKLTTVHGLLGSSQAGLLLATDGNFYGTTLRGGSPHVGTAFKITPSGKLTTLHTFCTQVTTCPDGAEPRAPLIQGRDGDLYGTTTGGGAGCTQVNEGCGTAFKMTRAGSLTELSQLGV